MKRSYTILFSMLLITFVFLSCSDDESSTEPTNNDPVAGEMVTVTGGTITLIDNSTKQIPDTVTVTLSDFSIGKYEVTQKEWEDVMDNNPSYDPTHGIGQGDDYPVYNICWFDILVYCNERSVLEGLTPCYSINASTDSTDWGLMPVYSADPTYLAWNAVECNWSANGYRMPTEAEWEFAARGGVNWTDDYTYSGSNDIDDVACYNGNSDSIQLIGTRSANQIGLYDMSGNLYEFCWDWYGTYSGDFTDPTGAPSGDKRIVRGGAWSQGYISCAVDGRYGEFPNSVFAYNGFRVVRKP